MIIPGGSRERASAMAISSWPRCTPSASLSMAISSWSLTMNSVPLSRQKVADAAGRLQPLRGRRVLFAVLDDAGAAPAGLAGDLQVVVAGDDVGAAGQVAEAQPRQERPAGPLDDAGMALESQLGKLLQREIGRGHGVIARP